MTRLSLLGLTLMLLGGCALPALETPVDSNCFPLARKYSYYRQYITWDEAEMLYQRWKTCMREEALSND